MQVDLVGGYYDAGDNVKFGFPMAFTTTMLSWSVIEFGGLMKGELQNAREAIRWATDYLLKATAKPNTIYVQVFFFSCFSPVYSALCVHFSKMGNSFIGRGCKQGPRLLGKTGGYGYPKECIQNRQHNSRNRGGSRNGSSSCSCFFGLQKM